MNDEVAFLRHINENPNDFTARLVFADWLEERDEPALRERGAFIRAQFRLEELPEWDPGRYPLLATAHRAFGKYRHRWVSGLEGRAGDAPFRRGFVEEARMSLGELLVAGNELLEAAPIRSLVCWPPGRNDFHEWTVNRGELSDVLARMEADPRWGAIQEIDFGTGMNLPEWDWEGGTCPGVRRVRVPSAPSRFNRLLDSLPGLEHLAVPLDDPGLGRLARRKKAPRLRSLDLSRSRFTPVGWKKFLGSGACSGVESLRVDSTYHRFGLENAKLLAESELPNLRRLSLRGNWVDEPGCVAIIDSDDLASLDELDLGDNHIYDQNMKGIAACSGLQRLRALGLHHNGVRNAGAKALARSPHWRSLECLDLYDNRVGDEGVKWLCRDGAFPALRSLNLLQNPLTGAGLSMLAASELGGRLEDLSVFTANVEATTWTRWFRDRDVKLVRLRLDCRAVSLADVKELGKVAFPASLIELDLSKCSMPSQAVRYLAKLPQLSQLAALNLAGNDLDDAAVRALAQSRELANLHTLGIASYSGTSEETYRALIDSPYLTRLARLRVAPPNGGGSEDLARELHERFGNTSLGE